jgi:ATP-dependent helicase HrpA
VDVVRADIKVDMLQPHFFMNFRVVDEHGRQLGTGRNLGALKAELGAQGAWCVSGAGFRAEDEQVEPRPVNAEKNTENQPVAIRKYCL